MTIAIRKYKTKNGEIKIKCYDTIKGVDFAEYKRQQSRRYYHEQRLTQKPIYGKATRIDKTSLDAMKSHHLEGMSIRQIAKKFGLSRYTATKALANL
jgi:YesN/AraC family two-component response regulator